MCYSVFPIFSLNRLLHKHTRIPCVCLRACQILNEKRLLQIFFFCIISFNWIALLQFLNIIQRIFKEYYLLKHDIAGFYYFLPNVFKFGLSYSSFSLYSQRLSRVFTCIPQIFFVILNQCSSIHSRRFCFIHPRLLVTFAT